MRGLKIRARKFRGEMSGSRSCWIQSPEHAALVRKVLVDALRGQRGFVVNPRWEASVGRASSAGFSPTHRSVRGVEPRLGEVET
jgi:hypothetical protein